MNPENIPLLSLSEVAAAISSGAIASVAATQACLDRIAALDGRVNSFIRVDAEQALATAAECDRDAAEGKLRGPLHGVPLAHKDMFDRLGKVSTGGSRILADRVADRTATILQRLDRSGAIDLGTLNLSEFAAGPTGHNVHYGDCHNAFDHAFIAGGSSSGPAAAVASRLVFAALGSDTGASVRVPAAVNGLTGMKPTYGRVSRHGAMPRSWSLDHVGPLARSARDLALIYGVIAGSDPDDPTTLNQPDVESPKFGSNAVIRGLRIGMLKGAVELGVHPEIAQTLETTGATLKQMGATLVQITLPDLQPLYATAEIIVKSEAAAIHRNWLQTRPQDYGAHVRARIEAGLAITATQYIDALRLRPILARDFIASVFGSCDVMLLPTIPMPVPTIAETDVERRGGEEILAVVGQITRFTRPLSLIGLPVVTAPCGFSQNGLPIGFQFAGRPFQEARLMEVVDAFQQATRFHLTPPSIAAPLSSAS